ncbi:MAG TPA: hypothetical protein PKC18_16545, partial [Lacipirellulaceae bacterium]|nr:hypothetical protein [Lacipirellulaceae bacterium]
MRRRAFIRSALGAACLLGSAGTAWLITPPRGELLEIAVIATGDEAVDRLLIAGAQDAADQHRLRLHVHRPELGDSRNQSQLLATAAGLDPAAGVICPVSPARQHHAIASAAGRTVVVTCGRDAPDSGRMIFIGHGDFRTGRMAAQLVKRLAPGGATVCVVQERGNESH